MRKNTSDDDEQETSLFFRREDSVQENAEKFINDFDPLSIIMTTDLFKEEYCELINRKFNPYYKQKD